MTTTTAPAASLADAFAHAERLLETDPRLAAEQARAILEVVPRHADTTRLLAAALRLSGDAEGGLATIAPLAQALPNLPLAQLELALCLERLGRTAEAEALRMDSQQWARYGFGSEAQMRARTREIAALGAKGSRG